ncbi:MAG: hypothetical protein KC417_14060, partial [Myxococcales bacterium]|nr:hypothetical protein [Myxococcales bacterium]
MHPEAPERRSSRVPREAAYDGRFAATRLEHVHFRGAAGEPLSADVHVVVNVSTDPSLRQLALDDTLHVVRGGPPLAVPYVFHDPAAKKFALVLPIALRHHEFAERAQLLLALGEDESAAIPAYVRAARVCVGAVELAAYLREQGPGETAERPLDARSDEDLRERESFLERSFADLAIREQALAERLALLQEREEIAAGVHDAETSAGEYLAADGLESQRRLDGALTADEADDFEEDEDVEEEEVDEGELDAVEDVSPDEVLDADSQVGEPVPDVAFVEEDRGPALADDPGRISSVEVDTDEFEALEALEGPDMEATYVAEGYEDVTGPHPRTLPPSETPSSEAFFTRSAQEMAIDDSRRGVTLLVRLTEGKEGVFADPQNPAELLVQLMDVQDYPVVVLALMQRGERRPYVRREVLDPCTPAHRRVLEQLAERFAAEAIVYAADGRSVGTFELVGNRELNVTRVLEAVDAMSIPVDVDRAAVLERALAAPPPAGGSGHPFGEPDSHPVPSELVALLPLLDKWASLEQQSRAALVLSVPVPDIETVLDRRIQEALERGLHLPTALEEEAIRRGFAVDAAALVGTAIRAFPNTVGLVGRSQAADNWEQLLTRAMDLDVPVEDATVEAAWEAIRQVRGAVEDQAELASLDAGKLDSLSVRALTAVLHHPTLRGAALRALATRGEGVDPEEVVQAFGKLP